MLQAILFITLLLIGGCLIIFYEYVTLWKIPREKEKRIVWSWVAFLCSAMSTFSFLLAWIVHDPRAGEFFPVFIIFSVIIGFLFRESAISPYRLMEFWSSFKKRNPQKNDKS